MKKALISPQEQINNFDGTAGYRVAQVEEPQNTFDVAGELHWVDCDDDVVADQFYFDTADNTIKVKPTPPAPEPKSNTTNTVV